MAQETCGHLIAGNPGRPCARKPGHNDGHRDREQMERKKEYARAWHVSHREQRVQKKRAHYRANRERITGQQRERYRERRQQTTNAAV